MKSFELKDKDIALAAVEDAKNFGLLATYDEAQGKVEYEESQAYSMPAVLPPTSADIESLVSSVVSSYSYELKWMREDISSLWKKISEHVNDGHLPAIKDAGQMKKALKALGLEDSYNVQVPTVYVQY